MLTPGYHREALIAVTGDPKTVADAIAMRDVLDPLCLVEAARYRSEPDLADLRVHLDQMRALIDDDLGFKRSIWAFYRRIVEICRNAILRAVSLSLLELLSTQTETVVPGSDTLAHRRQRIKVHESLVDAIASGDEHKCAKASRAHAVNGAA